MNKVEVLVLKQKPWSRQMSQEFQTFVNYSCQCFYTSDNKKLSYRLDNRASASSFHLIIMLLTDIWLFEFIYINNNKMAASRKEDKYVDLGARYTFEPIAVETLGIFNASARHLLADLGRRISINIGEARETSYLFQGIYVLV